MSKAYGRVAAIAITFTIESIITIGALIQALLAAYLITTQPLFGFALAWSDPFTRVAHGLLWPLTRLAGAPVEAIGPGIVPLAMALYLSLTIASIGAINLLARQPLAQTPPTR